MTNDKAYCIRSNKFMVQPCSNTACDRHEENAPLDEDRRQWARFDECKEYRIDVNYPELKIEERLCY